MLRTARTLSTLVALALIAAPLAARNFQPPREWTARGGAEAQRDVVFVDSAALHPLADGSVLWVGNDSEARGIALRALLRPGQPPAMDQFGDSLAQHALRVDRVLYADADAALVQLRESNPPAADRRVLSALDLDGGGVSWALPLAADAALRRPDGDSLVLAGGGLLRLSPGGATRWVRHVEEFGATGVRQDAVALLAEGDRVFVVLSRVQAAPGGDTPLGLRVLAFDAADGALAWRVDTDGLRACGAARVGGALVVAGHDAASAGGTATFSVRRFAATDGAVVAATTIAAVPANAPTCSLLDVDGGVLLATADASAATTLVAIDAIGALRWRADLGAGTQPAIARVPGSDDIVFAANLPAGGARRIERRRGGDGGLTWSTMRNSAAVPALRTFAVSAQGVHLVAQAPHPIVATLGSLEREDLSLADGTLLAPSDTGLSLRTLLPYDAQFVDGAPFDAALAADGAIEVRRRNPLNGTGVLWSRIEPSTPTLAAIPSSIAVRGAGPGRLLAVANYRILAGSDARREGVLLMLDRDSGAVVWRLELGREIDRLGDVPIEVLDANASGVLLSLAPCPLLGICSPGPRSLRRLSAADGGQAWESPTQSFLAAIAGDDVVAFELGIARQWRLLVAPAGLGGWAQPVAATANAFDLALAPGGFLSSLGATVGGVPQVDVERRSIADGAVLSTLRAGLAGDRVAAPVMRPAVNGLPLLTARVAGPEPGQEDLQRPLLQLLTVDGASAQRTLRPLLSGADRWWTLRPVASSTGSITRQPLRSLRYLESINQPYNSRIALASLDLGSGTLGGEQLVERRFDDALRGDGGVELVQVLAGGAILAVEPVLGGDGLRRRTLLRLGAPAEGGGDLRMRLLDAGAGGPGALQRVRAEIDNHGATEATNAAFGLAPRRDRGAVHAVFAACSVVGGSATCPAPGAASRVTLAPGATVRLEWDVLDAGFSATPTAGASPPAGARIFVDAPWGYADTEPGNNVVDFTLGLVLFADGFE